MKREMANWPTPGQTDVGRLFEGWIETAVLNDIAGHGVHIHCRLCALVSYFEVRIAAPFLAPAILDMRALAAYRPWGFEIRLIEDEPVHGYVEVRPVIELDTGRVIGEWS